MKDIFSKLWTEMVKLYTIYSNFIHSILPAELGDLAEAVINIIVVCLIIKLIAGMAFRTKDGDI